MSCKQTGASVEQIVRYSQMQLKILFGFKFVLIVLTLTNARILEFLLKASVFQRVSGLPDKASPVLLSCRIQGQHQCQVFSCVERGHWVVVGAERLDSVR